jgi:hypothetical protein
MADEVAARVAVRLELEPGADPIAGSCTCGDGPPERFVGWLGLMAALERTATSQHRVQTPGERNEGSD